MLRSGIECPKKKMSTIKFVISNNTEVTEILVQRETGKVVGMSLSFPGLYGGDGGEYFITPEKKLEYDLNRKMPDIRQVARIKVKGSPMISNFTLDASPFRKSLIPICRFTDKPSLDWGDVQRHDEKFSYVLDEYNCIRQA